MVKCIRKKVVVAGEPAVGKTALVQMLTTGGQKFPKNYQMTQCEFACKTLPQPDSDVHVELHLFDTGGQDVFSDLMPQYWEGAEGVILVFDVTRPDSLHACEAWYNRLREALQRERLPAVLVGNKADLTERVEVTRQDANAFGERMRLPVVEASAMPPGQDIEGGFQALAALLAAQESDDF